MVACFFRLDRISISSNLGRVATDGDLAIGVVLGVRNSGIGTADGGTIVNRGVIDTEGDGAAGVVMIGNGHPLTNSGRIATDGGVGSGSFGVFRAALATPIAVLWGA